MKKKVLLVILCFPFILLIANDFQQPHLGSKNVDPHHFRITDDSFRDDHPEITFEIDPAVITYSLYDYMPGGYNVPPLFRQPVSAEPSMYPADGFYMAFMYQENATSLRRAYYCYMDSGGNLQTPVAVSSNSVREGFPGIAIDPITANPFVAWHNIVEPDDSYDCSFSYDMYNVIGTPGLWAQSQICTDNPEIGMDIAGIPNVEYIWPELRIGPSPMEGYRRLHVLVTNSTANASGSFLDNILYGYCDFQYDSTNFAMELTDWTYQTFDEIDEWWLTDDRRAIKDYAVSEDGQVLVIGHAGTNYLAYHSSDYGESFQYIEQEASWDIFEPWIIDPVTYEPVEPYFDGEDCIIEPNSDGKHYNVLFIENNTKAVFMTTFGVNTIENLDQHLYLPAFFEPKIVTFDIATQEFSFTDLQVPGADGYDDMPMIPWDLDEDGEVDAYDDEGYPVFADCWPTYFFAGDFADGAFDESLFKMAKNEEQGWLVTLFQDGRKLKNSFYEEPGYEDWFETPEIAIAASFNNGETWSYPTYLNAKADDENYFEELEGMIPAYAYISEEIEYVSENVGRIHMFFYDDNSYGSFVGQNAHGLQNGGNLMYASLLVDFDFDPMNFVDAGDEIVDVNLNLSQNYPNPFNPTTTIDYSLDQETRVEIEVFNIKGQHVKTLISETKAAGDHFVIWNGTDDSQQKVSSGIYFYRLKTKSMSQMKKMILMK